MRENLRVDNILDPDAVSQGEMMVNHLLLPCGEQSGLGGFGVALHPFSKGGKRDLAERTDISMKKTELSSAFSRSYCMS